MRLLSLLALLSLLLISCGDGSRFVTVTFPDGTEVRCEIADTTQKHRAGLTTYDSLEEDQGMLFYYDTEREYGSSFWMPNTMKFRIDIIFLGEDKVINMIHRNVEICESNREEDCPSYMTDKPTKYVIEVVAGFCDKRKLKIGDSVDFEL